MTDRLITHLRHVDLAVPDHAKQLDFFTGTWGPTAEHSDTGLDLPGRRGIARAVHRPAAAVRRQAHRPHRVRRGERRPRRCPGGPARPGRGTADQRTRRAGDTGRRLRVPVLRPQGPHRGDQLRRRGPRAPEDRGRRVDPGPAVARRRQLGLPRGHRGVVPAGPGLRAVRHPHPSAHGRDDVVPADQQLAPQPRRRLLPAPVAAPRLVRAARHRRVHARHRQAAPRRGGEDLGTGTAPGRQHIFSYFLDPHGNTVEYTTELERVDEDAWHPHLYDFTQLGVADQWGTANQMNEFVATKSFNDPDRGMFTAPPV